MKTNPKKRMSKKYLIIFFNVIICVCAFVLGTRMAKRFFNSSTDSLSPAKLMMAVVSRALTIRAFPFDYDVATGTLDPATPRVYRESIEQNLRRVLSLYKLSPAKRHFLYLQRNSQIAGATPTQNEAYRQLLIKREVAIARERKLAITEEIREVLGDLKEEYKVRIVGGGRKPMSGDLN